MAEDTQPVVPETDAAAPPPAEETNAQDNTDELDTLLAQYEQETTTPPPASPVQNPPEQSDERFNALLQKVDALEGQISARDTETDLTSLVGSVVGETGQPDYAVQGFIDQQAKADPRLRTAWENRRTDPKGFEKVAKALARDFAKTVKGQPDPQTSEDVAAVTAAVRGSSTTAPEAAPESYNGDSDQSFREKVFKKHGYMPQV